MTVKIVSGTDRSDGLAGVWNGSRSHLRVILRDVVAEASIGLHPWEQHAGRPTRLIVNVEMFASIPHGLKNEARATLIDYDMIRNVLRTWPERPHTPLIETLLEEVVGLCFQNQRVEACRVSIVKPDIFNEAAAAGVEVYMTRQDHTAA